MCWWPRQRRYLTKRIPQNPRYQHVKSRLDTGNSMTKYIEKLEEIKKNYRYKKDELFKRLKVTTFAQLCLLTYFFTCSVISGVGELDLDKGLVKKVEPSTKDKPYPDCPFLLLDVRDRDSYQQCHIVGAYSYPIATLSRTMNPYSNDILEYKNAHGKIIILYDDDERLASQAATTMCERGFENLFMLSGGLKVLAQKFPEGLITGSLPASCQQTLPPASARKRSGPKVPPPAAENKWRFTPEDLKKIEYYLEEDQGPADSTSRLSQGNASGRDSKVPGSRSGQNLPAGGPAGHQNPRSLGSGHLQGKPWK
ncbi:hypothetical protein EI555_004348 [Monodon monoceros]|uniref:Centrosomal protein of 41 kDa n=1 Tax=Monodon monoceros TaxID=40151 RepID=A0A4U1EE34_MONMO|nr:hypothetical protein EI555_004348 [Monodon monoceros]